MLSLTRSAVEISNTQNIGGTALGTVVQARARVIGAATAAAVGTDVVRDRSGHDGSSQESSDEGSKLHFRFYLRFLRLLEGLREL